MVLTEVREKINEIDADLMELLDKRAECSVGVATAKLGSGDLIYKPEREREICEKFEKSGKGMGTKVIKTIMRSSRLIQYEMYVDEGIVPERFTKMLKDADCLKKCVKFDITINFDNANTKKLSSSDILLVLAESELEISTLKITADTIAATLTIGSDDADVKKAYVLLLMLYMETVNLEVK